MNAAMIGLDLSLSATGMVVWNGSGHHMWSRTVRTTPDEAPLVRMRRIAASVFSDVSLIQKQSPVLDPLEVQPPRPILAVIEGQFTRHNDGRSTQLLAGLRWIIAYGLDARGVSIADVPPATLKKFATGNGNATKDGMVVAAWQKLRWAASNDNEADALWLVAAGLVRYGLPPLCNPDLVNVSALSGVDWPQWSAA